MRLDTIRHEFVEFIPSAQGDGVLYVSVEYATAVHRCFCGCGEKVVTPLGPTDWTLIFDGRTVSLTPSVGNWGYACKSHYWIENDRVVWAGVWSQERIDAGRKIDRLAKQRHLSQSTDGGQTDEKIPETKTWVAQRLRRIWAWTRTTLRSPHR